LQTEVALLNIARGNLKSLLVVDWLGLANTKVMKLYFPEMQDAGLSH
jgi:hypothetical protein